MPLTTCQVERGIIAHMRIYAAKATLQIVRGMQKALYREPLFIFTGRRPVPHILYTPLFIFFVTALITNLLFSLQLMRS